MVTCLDGWWYAGFGIGPPQQSLICGFGAINISSHPNDYLSDYKCVVNIYITDC